MDNTLEQERIILPSKFTCEKHVYYSNDRPCRQCYDEKSIKIHELNARPNMPLAAFIDENGIMQVVVNTDDEGMLWSTWKRMEQAIAFVLTQKEIRRQQTSIQTAPASVLDKLGR